MAETKRQPGPTRGGPFKGGIPKAPLKAVKSKSDTVKRLFAYIKHDKLRLFCVVICIIISATAAAVSSLFLRTLIDNYILPLLEQSTPDYSGLLRIVLLMGTLYLAGVVATFLFSRIMAVIAQRVLKEIRDEMFSHMQTLSIKYFDTHSHGDVMSRYTNDTDTLRQAIGQSLPNIFNSLVTVIAVFVSMLILSVWLSLIVIVFVFLLLKVISLVAGKSRTYFVKQQEALGDVNGYVEEMINGQKVIKVFCHEKKAKSEFDEKNEQLETNAKLANRYANILMPTMISLGYGLYVVLAIAGAIMSINGITNVSLTGVGILTLGTLASFLQLSRNFVGPIGQVAQQLNPIISALAGAERIFTLMDEHSESDDGYVKLVHAAEVPEDQQVKTDTGTARWYWKHPHSDGTVTYTELKGEVRFYDVDFSYTKDKPVLKNITLYAKPGQKVAFVGATGAGKTTITNLINRFYDIADGKVRYDGININKIRKEDLRASLGMVLQDVSLFTGTVMENIRFGRLDATDDECIAAAKLANADGFINLLPNGYNTILSGDGSGLSQGQRQLISIARAAVADPPVMILDEATSSIDTRTELHVQRGMDSLMKGRTVFVIAHRLSTIKNANVIMVLDNGEIIERGTHEELLEQKGTYYNLYTGALKLE